MLSTKTIAFCLAALSLFIISSCRRQTDFFQQDVTCIHNDYPVSGPALTVASGLVPVSYDTAICGFMPMQKDAYWIYTDSFFNSDGSLNNIQQDTLKVRGIYKSPAGPSLFWLFTSRYPKGTNGLMYTTDSTLYAISQAFTIPSYFESYPWAGFRAAGYPNRWAPVEGPRNTDSILTYNNYTDIVYPEKIVTYRQPVTVPAGSFGNCIGYLKRFGWYPTEAIYQPGLGIVKFISYYNPPPGSFSFIPVGGKQQVSVLTGYHLF